MRTHRWFKALTFGLCLGAGTDAAFAQAPWSGGGQGTWVTADGSPAPAPGTYQPQMGGYPPQMPGTFQAPYATNNPDVLYPPQTPEGFSPWPQVSPYGMGNYSRDTMYNQDGVWFREILNKRRDYYFNVNVLGTTTKKAGHALIGAPTQRVSADRDGIYGYYPPTYGNAGQPGSGTGNNNNNNGGVPAGYVFVDRGVIPFVFMRDSDTDILGDPILDSETFPIRDAKILSEYRSAGTQLNFGWDNEDGTGFNAGAWWGFSNSQSFQRGTDSINGIPINQAMIINQGGRMLFTRNGAVSFDTGIRYDIIGDDTVDDPGIYGGVIGTQKYDVLYRLSSSSQSGGGDMQFYLPSLLNPTSGIQLRPVYGAKYMYLGETFGFRGIDSGLSYEVDSGGTGGGTGGGNNQNQPTYRPDGDLIIDSEMFETQVNARTRSHLAGPMAGLRYDFGRSRNFKLWGQSSFGLMANHEEVRVHGFNAGENVMTRILLGNNMLDGDSSFADRQTHTHVSPLFEQTFMAESRVLSSLPVVKHVPLLSDANLKLGYTQTFVGNVARPAQSIQWNGFPKAPKVDIDYQSWYIGRMNLGLEWNF